MKNRKLAVGIAGLCLAVGMSGVAVAANSAAVPKSVTVKQSTSFKFVPNRYIQDGLRFNKDVYKVKSGGTVNFVFNITDEGPHSLTIVRKKDLPKTPRALFGSPVLKKLADAHGADPNSEAPPKFQFLENGVGENGTVPNLDRPGDSGVFMTNKKGEKISFKVTAKKGKDLYFLCLIHPWMQAELEVG
jgi:plastocyanin